MDITSYLFNKGLSEVSYKDFYRDIFPKGSFEDKGIYEQGKYNGIFTLMCKIFSAIWGFLTSPFI